MSKRVKAILDVLKFDMAENFASMVEARLRRLSDDEVNELHLLTHTPLHLGEFVGTWVAVLLPLIEAEAQLRRDIQILPSIGPIVAPELYRQGGGHYVPF